MFHSRQDPSPDAVAEVKAAGQEAEVLKAQFCVARPAQGCSVSAAIVKHSVPSGVLTEVGDTVNCCKGEEASHQFKSSSASRAGASENEAAGRRARRDKKLLAMGSLTEQ